MVVFEVEANQTEKAEEERKSLQNVYIFVRVTAGSQNVRERVRLVSVSHRLRG